MACSDLVIAAGFAPIPVQRGLSNSSINHCDTNVKLSREKSFAILDYNGKSHS